MAYPISFRRKVLSVREKEGLTIAQTAVRFCVGIASVTRWIKNPVPKESRNKPATKIDMAALARDVREYPDAYQGERARRLGVSEKGIGHALRRMNISYKKTLQHPKKRTKTNLTKVVLLTICHEHMGMHPLVNGVTASVIGTREAVSMSSVH